MNHHEILERLKENENLEPAPRPAESTSASSAAPSSLPRSTLSSTCSDQSQAVGQTVASLPTSETSPTSSASRIPLASSSTPDSPDSALRERFPDIVNAPLDDLEEIAIKLGELDIEDSPSLPSPPPATDRWRPLIPSLLSSAVKPPLSLDKPYPIYQAKRARKDYLYGNLSGSALVKVYLNNERVGGSTDRTRRVQEMSKHEHGRQMDERERRSQPIQGEGESVETGDICAALVTYGKVKSLALIFIVDISVGKDGYRSEVPIVELEKPTTTIRGQILAHHLESSDPDSASSDITFVFPIKEFVPTSSLVEIPAKSAVFAGLRDLEFVEELGLAMEVTMDQGKKLLDAVERAAGEAGRVGEVKMEKGGKGFPYQDLEGELLSLPSLNEMDRSNSNTLLGHSCFAQTSSSDTLPSGSSKCPTCESILKDVYLHRHASTHMLVSLLSDSEVDVAVERMKLKEGEREIVKRIAKLDPRPIQGVVGPCLAHHLTLVD